MYPALNFFFFFFWVVVTEMFFVFQNFYRYRGSVEHGAPYVPQPNDNGRSNPSHTPPPMTRSNSNRSPPSLHVD